LLSAQTKARGISTYEDKIKVQKLKANNEMKWRKSFAMKNLLFEACRKPKTPYIRPIHLHPSLDETDSSPASNEDEKNSELR
jgi:hypothetical protein